MRRSLEMEFKKCIQSISLVSLWCIVKTYILKVTKRQLWALPFWQCDVMNMCSIHNTLCLKPTFSALGKKLINMAVPSGAKILSRKMVLLHRDWQNNYTSLQIEICAYFLHFQASLCLPLGSPLMQLYRKPVVLFWPDSLLFQSEDGRTALHMTALHGRFTRAQTLIEHGESLSWLAQLIPHPTLYYLCWCLSLLILHKHSSADSVSNVSYFLSDSQCLLMALVVFSVVAAKTIRGINKQGFPTGLPYGRWMKYCV